LTILLILLRCKLKGYLEIPFTFQYFNGIKKTMTLYDIIRTPFDLRCIICGERDLNKKIKFICNKCHSIFDLKKEKACKVCGHPFDRTGKCPSCKTLGTIYFDSLSFIQYYTGFFKSMFINGKLKKIF